MSHFVNLQLLVIQKLILPSCGREKNPDFLNIKKLVYNENTQSFEFDSFCISEEE